MKIDLSGKVALVTGASGDLGRVISTQLAECGADVAINYHRSKDRAEELRDRLEKMGRRTCLVQADVTDQASVRAMKEQIERELGAPDILVNNAVIQYTWTTVLEQGTGRITKASSVPASSTTCSWPRPSPRR